MTNDPSTNTKGPPPGDGEWANFNMICFLRGALEDVVGKIGRVFKNLCLTPICDPYLLPICF